MTASAHWPNVLTRLLEPPRISLAFLVTVIINAVAIAAWAKYFADGLAIATFVEALRLGFFYAFVLTLVALLPGALLLRALRFERLWHFVATLGFGCALLTFLLMVLWIRQGEALMNPAAMSRLAGMFALGAVSGASFWWVAYAGSNR